MLTLYIDAARQVDTGKTAGGCVLIENHQQQQLKTQLPSTVDNHEAEFLAAKWAIDQVDRKPQALQLFFDSKLVAESLNKHYAKHYQPLVDQIDQGLSQFPLVLISWVAEKSNQGAHQLALQALKKAD